MFRLNFLMPLHYFFSATHQRTLEREKSNPSPNSATYKHIETTPAIARVLGRKYCHPRKELSWDDKGEKVP